MLVEHFTRDQMGELVQINVVLRRTSSVFLIALLLILLLLLPIETAIGVCHHLGLVLGLVHHHLTRHHAQGVLLLELLLELSILVLV